MTTARSPRRGAVRRKFYQVRHGRGRAGGFELLNGDRLFPALRVPAENRSHFLRPNVPLQNFPEAPIFLSDAKLGPIARDFEYPVGYWFISEKMKSVLQAVDPEAFAFLQCHVRSRDGQERPTRWLCNVVRILDALDEERSKVRIGVASNGNKFYNLLGVPKLVFKEAIVGCCHIFKMKYSPETIICDQEMREACKSAKITGISFEITE